MWESTNKGGAKTEQSGSYCILMLWILLILNKWIPKVVKTFERILGIAGWKILNGKGNDNIARNVFKHLIEFHNFKWKNEMLEDSRHIISYVEKNENLKHNCCFCRKEKYCEAGLFPGFVTFQLKEHFGNHTFSVLQSLTTFIIAVSHWHFSIREGAQKNLFFLGNSPKQRTPPTHPYGLGLT